MQYKILQEHPFPPRKKKGRKKKVKANHDTLVLKCDVSEDHEFMEAFKEAIQDPENRKQIISILETYGLLPFADRWPA